MRSHSYSRTILLQAVARRGGIAKPQAVGEGSHIHACGFAISFAFGCADMVIAHHLIWTAYGWWLPNDPRGSMSRTTTSDVIAELGQLHYGRKRVQPSTRALREFFDRSKDKLKFERVEFSPHDVNLIADAIGETIRSRVYTCYACAIMPDHVHLVIRKHRDTAEKMIGHFQEDSRLKLLDSNMREQNHPVWGGPGRKVFLDSPDDIHRTIPYVQDNPIKIRRSKQVWDFVKDYDGWPFHAGSRMRMR